MPEEEENDVEAESSIAEVEESEVVNLDAEIQEEQSEESEEAAEVDEESEESESEEEVEEEQPKEKEKEVNTQKVPLPRLRKEIDRRKQLEEKVEALEALVRSDKVPVKQEEGTPKAPTLKSSNYDQDAYDENLQKYQEELVDWKLEQRDKKTNNDNIAKEQKDLRDAAIKRVEDFYGSSEEYQNVVKEIVDNNETINYPDSVVRALDLSELGPQIDLFILQDRDNLIPKLNSMTPEQQYLEIGRIQGIISYKTQSKKEPKKTISKAPDPIKKQVRSSRSSALEEQMKKDDPGFKMY